MLRSAFWERLAQWVVNHSRLIVVGIGALTVFFAVSMTFLERGTHVKYFHSYQARDLSDTIEDKFDEGRYASIMFEAQGDHSLLEPELLKQQFLILQDIRANFKVDIDSLVEGIDAGLKRVKRKSLLEVEDYDDIAEAILALAGSRTVYDLERVSRHLLSNPDIVEFYEKFRILSGMVKPAMPSGSKRKYGMPYLKAVKSYIQLDPELDVKGQKKAIVAIRDLVSKYNSDRLAIHMYGEDLVSFDVDANSRRNAVLMGLILILFDSLLLWAIFKRRREVYLSFLILVTACLWTFGAAGLIGMDISFLHLMVLPILLGTGVDDIVVFGKRLAEEQKKGVQLKTALIKTYQATGNSILLTTLTTFLAFLTGALISDIQGVASFFLLISVSMVVVFVLTIFLEGAVRIELDKRKISWLEKEGRTPTFLERANESLTYFPRLASKAIRRHPRRLVRFGVLLTLLALAIGMRVETEFERKIFMRPHMPTFKADQKEDEYFGRSDVGYVLIEGNVANYEVLQKMRRLEATMSRYKGIEKILRRANVESVNELLDKRRLFLKPNANVKETFDFLSENQQTANYSVDETYAESSRHLMHKTGDDYDALVMKFFVEGAQSKEVQAIVAHLEDEAQRLGFNELEGVQVRIGGGEISSDLEQETYFRNMISSFFSSLAITFIVLLLFWRRLSHALLAVIPLVIAAALSLGIMVLFGVKLNVLNLTVGIIIVGLGIDYPIHIIERYKEEGSVQKVLNRMGPNIFGAAMTTIVGFAASMIMAMPIAQSFGALVAVAIFIAYMASIFILPIALGRSKSV